MSKKLLFVVLVCALATSALAAEIQWFGGAHDRDWFNPVNWNAGAGPVPTNLDKAKVNYVWANPGPIITTPMAVGEIFISEDLDPGCIGEQSLTVATGGEVTTGSDGGIPYSGHVNIGYFGPHPEIPHPGNNGRLIMDGGTMNITGHLWLGWGGVGHLNVNSGTLNVGTLANPTMFGIGWNGGSGTINLDGGLLHTTQWWGGVDQAHLDNHNYTFDITHGTWEIHGWWENQLHQLVDNGWITGYGGAGTVNVAWDPVRELTVVTAITAIPDVVVNVIPWIDPNITTFDPNHRPPDMDPNLDGDARPRVDSNCSFTGQWDANGTYKVNDVNVTIKGHTDIRVCQDANGNPDANVLDHEANGHNSLNGYVYQDANKIIEDTFRKFIGKIYVGEGNTPQQRDANALQQAQDDAKKLMDRAIDAIIQNMDKLGEKFDKLTNGGIGPTEDDPNALTTEDGVKKAKEDQEAATKAGEQPEQPDEEHEEQSGVDGNESSFFFDDSEQKLYLNEGQVLSTASNPSDTILGRGEVRIDPIVLVGVQENGTVLLSDTRLKIIDNVNGGALLDGFILEVAYMESTLPGFAGMIQGYLDVPPVWAGGINNAIGSEFLAGIQAVSEAGDCNRLPMVWFYTDQQLFDEQGDSSIPPTGASGKLILGVAVVSEPNVVKVQIHVVKGSGITEGQVREGLKKANEADANAARFVVDSNHFYEDPNTDPNDPNNNDPNRINIWAVRRCKVTGEPNNVSGCKGNIVELVDPNGTKDPNDANAPKVYMKDSTLAHELNHIFGLDHNEPNGHPITDPNNKMYPDNWKDAGVRTSCHRKGAKLEEWQREKIRKSKVWKAKDAVDSGYGGDAYDNVGDVDFGYIDLDWTQAWIEWLSPYILHLTAQVGSLSFESYSELGFYIESDGNPSTGQPPEGLDYYVAFQPASNQIIFEIYDAEWVPLDPNGITYELTYTWKDADVPPVPSGVKFEVPMALLHRKAGNVISYRAVAQNDVQMDVSPNAGLLSVALPPWLPDFVPDGVIDYKDLDVLTDNWLSSPPIDPNVDLYPDGRIDFRDFTEFGKYWRQHQP